ncbi:histidine phosphatase family protein [Vibrio sp. 10N.261.55.A7]|uniref:histidine phosphatase family protein n=1 Tax=Vibrio sp. 10N.261.55.A7 TaxID=1880851 RepID=UPI000C81B892|nr:histidine phosphatase family protein [Vibrio sp. 10N.261.55.A7]PMJ89845.1 alpha-ribazole phosphatase [Vibrio sp. 10N.261.55.A7]
MEDATRFKTYNVYLLRHGKTVGEPSLNGITDVIVSDETQQQIAKALSKESLGYSQVITSPLRRCKDLADKLVMNNPSVGYSVNSGFVEMDFGDYDGQSFDALRPYWPNLDSFWKDPANKPLPNAESLHDCYQRVTDAWENMVANLNKDTLIVCHGGTIRLILAYILKTDYTNSTWYSALNIGNQSLTHIKIHEEYKNNPHVQMIGKPLC